MDLNDALEVIAQELAKKLLPHIKTKECSRPVQKRLTKYREEKIKGIARLWCRWEKSQREGGPSDSPNSGKVKRFREKHSQAINAIQELQTKRKWIGRSAFAVFFCMLYERQPTVALANAKAFYRGDKTNPIAFRLMEMEKYIQPDRSPGDSLALLDLCIESTNLLKDV